MALREEFDRKRDFIVAKPVTLSGKHFQRGEAFDKGKVTTRLLRQLYDTRYLGMLAPVVVELLEEEQPAPIAPRSRRRRPVEGVV